MPRTHLNTAQKLYQSGQYTEAERACRLALKAKPGDGQATRLLGQITRRTGKAKESIAIFQQLGRARPNDIQLLGELGASMTAAGLHTHALPILNRAVKALPNAAQWKIHLARCLLGLFQTNEAITLLEQALTQSPDDSDAHFLLANAYLNAARRTEAEPHARAYLAHHPTSVPGRAMLANILEYQGKLDEAITLLEETLGPDRQHIGTPAYDQATGGLIRCLSAQGRYDEALKVCEPLTLARPTPTLVQAIAPLYLSQKRHAELQPLLERTLDSDTLPTPDRASLLFSLAQAHRALGQHDEAFDTFTRANECYPDTFDRAHKRELYTEIRRVFSKEAIATAPRATLDASDCVFIVGMPRSGTSLIEQIIDAHPNAHGCGELVFLPHAIDALATTLGTRPPTCFAHATAEDLDQGARLYLDQLRALAPEAARLTDKLPHNFEMLGLINRMLPGARVIHCRRNPVDTCVSAYCTQLSAWHSYATRLDTLGWAYAQYADLMRHWHEVCDLPLLDVQYEAVVADLDTQARRIIEFVGLPWDDRCLRFYQTTRAVTTASVEQVRQPIYTSSVARWKRDEAHLAPLLEALAAAGVEIPDA